MGPLWRARVSFLLNSHPQETWKKFQTDRRALIDEMVAVVERAMELRSRLEAEGKLAPDKIEELVFNIVAPTDVPGATPLPENQETQIWEWAMGPSE